MPQDNAQRELNAEAFLAAMRSMGIRLHIAAIIDRDRASTRFVGPFVFESQLEDAVANWYRDQDWADDEDVSLDVVEGWLHEDFPFVEYHTLDLDAPAEASKAARLSKRLR